MIETSDRIQKQRQQIITNGESALSARRNKIGMNLKRNSLVVEEELEEMKVPVMRHQNVSVHEKPMTRIRFRPEEDLALRMGIQMYGNQWSLIKDDVRLQGRTAMNLKDRARTLKL